jgi:hypothetical protein
VPKVNPLCKTGSVLLQQVTSPDRAPRGEFTATAVCWPLRALSARAQRALKREARAVPGAFVGEGATLCEAKGISAATGRKSSRGRGS